MAYTNDIIDRYQYGGDLYAAMESSYGTSNADYIAALAATGDPVAVASEVNTLKNGPAANESTASILWGQLTTNPLAAPIESANNLLSNTLGSLFKNPLVLVAILAGLFFFFGGGELIRGQLTKK